MKYDKATKETNNRTRTQHIKPDTHVNVDMTKTCWKDAADDDNHVLMMIN